jgi:ATP-dependent Clp protease ATP-binding subunit ClpA
MVPFERFTTGAKMALAFAQEAAQDAGADIEPEHLLLGIVHERNGLGARTLSRLGVSPEELDRQVGAGPQRTSEGLRGAPGAGVGRVIQLAFEEAVLMRHREVGTEHLLLGVVSEGTSRGATALAALGVSLERVRQMIRVLKTLPAAAPPITARMPDRALEIDTPNAPDVDAALYEAMRRAQQEPALNVRLDHLLLAISSQPDGRALLRSLGIDAAELKRLAPPPSVVDAQRRVRELQVMDEVLAARARAAAERALTEWIKTWWVRPTPPEAPNQPT